MLIKNEHAVQIIPTKPGDQSIIPRPIDRWGNVPTRQGKDCNGIHRCPKGPQDASNWAWISHGPNVWQERWKIIPWGTFYAIRFQPVGNWECCWRIVGVYVTMAQALEAMEGV